MCLILFAYNHHEKYRLVLAANRDEFYDRPAAPMTYWQDHPHVLAGRDLKSMGTWMGVSKNGKFAAITNYREPGKQDPHAPSRGHLVSDFLIGQASPARYIDTIAARAGKYNGFNLIVGNQKELFYFSNRGKESTRLESGIFGLSNRLLDTSWPKIDKGKKNLAALIDQHHHLKRGEIINLLQNQESPPDEQLPDTGVGHAWERTLSPIFITSPNYGTRCSTILTLDRNNHLCIDELIWKSACAEPTLLEENTFEFTIAPQWTIRENRIIDV